MMSHTSPLSRYSASIMTAAVTTFALLWVMQDLIQHSGKVPEPTEPTPSMTIVRLLEDIVIEPKPERQPPVPPELPPEPPPRQYELDDGGGQMQFHFEAPKTAPPGGPTGVGLPDGDMLPIVKVAPVYPNRAQTRGLEGYVLLQFTVDETGAVRDPDVVESSSPIFDRSALNAVLRFKYKPRVVNGSAVRVEGVLHRLTYELSGL